MEILLIPIDFSQNALNAAQYAVDLAPALKINKVVLYHSIEDEAASREETKKQLEVVKAQLDNREKIEVLCIANYLSLTKGINELADKYKVLLIVMGLTGRNKVGQILMGSNVFRVSQQITIPLLVVPTHAVFKKIENIGLALPMVPDLGESFPHQAIKTLIKRLKASLSIINVGDGKKESRASKEMLYAALKVMFEVYEELSPSYHFPTAKNIVESVVQFTEDNHIELLISTSGKYSFIQGMLRKSISKQLAYQSAVPLLLYQIKDKPAS